MYSNINPKIDEGTFLQDKSLMKQFENDGIEIHSLRNTITYIFREIYCLLQAIKI